MPAPLALAAPDADLVEAYLRDMRAVGRRTGRSTTSAARTCQSRLARNGGWVTLSTQQRIGLVGRARSYAS
jgi:hypothetical protein